MQAEFGLDSSDCLIGDWSASFVKGIARPGRIYIFCEHLCFLSSLFGVKTSLNISFTDVMAIEKSRVQLTPGIIVHTSGSDYHFGSIFLRERFLEQVNSIWKGSYVLVESALEEEEEAAQGQHAAVADQSVAAADSDVAQKLLPRSAYTRDGFLKAIDELQELINDELPVTPTNFFKLFVGNDSTFEHDYHVSRGDSEVEVGLWEPHAQYGITREVTYILKLNAPMGPPTTRTKEVHRYHLARDQVIIDTSMQMLDAPYGDYFRVESHWTIASKGAHACTVNIKANAVFSKSTLLKGTISSRTLSGMTEGFGVWVKNAKALIENKGLGKCGGLHGTPTTKSATTDPGTSDSSTRGPSPSVVNARSDVGPAFLLTLDVTSLLLASNLLVNSVILWVLWKIAARL